MATHTFTDPTFAIRWSDLAAEHAVPDIEAALERAQAAIDRIAGADLGSLTFAGTFGALERSTEEVDLAWDKLSHLQAVADSPAVREAYNALLPKVTVFQARIELNPGLWLRLKTFAASPAAQALRGIEARLVADKLAAFRLAGADLPDAARARLEAIESELAQVTQRYSENVLDATNAWELLVDDPARLAGLPPHAVATALTLARRKGHGTPERPVWRFTLQAPSMEPVMTYAEDEGLRRELWTASVAIGAEGKHDNEPLVKRILSLRREKAELLGKAHFADLVLERRMAKTGARALAFVEDLQRRAAPGFARECRDLEAFKAERTGEPAGPLKAWEVALWAERLRLSRYDFNEEALRPYFPMDRVIAGMFEIVRRVMGVHVVEKPAGSFDAWHPEVRAYDMSDAGGRHLGAFYADWHPRESKRGGAWMGSLITGAPRPDGPRGPHLGYICGNMTPPVDGRPALLTHREVQTVFHEFGHLLHHLLSEVPVRSLAGTNVAWDFVELPSQIMENWTWEREGLDLFARHHETGEPIPEALYEKMIAARRFRGACAVMRQIQFAKMDLVLHMRSAAFTEGDLESKVRVVIEDCMIPTQPPARTVVKRFNHLFSDPVGYAAGYYSYKWAEVLDADAFTRFQREGIFNAKTGADFVEYILSKGDSADAGDLYRAFMGRDPDLSALLVRSGLTATPA
jgi:oligopeptidase A